MGTHMADAGSALSSGYVPSAEQSLPRLTYAPLVVSSTGGLEIKTYILLLLMMFFGTAGNAILDKGMKGIGLLDLSSRPAIGSGVARIFASGAIWLGIACLLLYMLSHMLVLSWADYSYVMPFTAISYALVPLAGYMWLGEAVALTRWLGIALIVCGVFLVSRTPPNTTGHAGRAGAG
jgi:drug/metabolite transporter (DMT)-like permease